MNCKVLLSIEFSNNLSVSMMERDSTERNVLPAAVIHSEIIAEDSTNSEASLYGYFTAELQDVWIDTILQSYINEPSDIETLRQTSSLFNFMLKFKKSRLSMVIPILITNGHLGFPELMNCRRTSHHLKLAVDATLLAPSKHQWWKWEWSFPYRFSNAQIVSNFLTHFKSSTPNSNPFIGKRIEVEILTPGAYPAFLELLAQFGHFVNVADVNFGNCTVRRLADELPGVLIYLPKIQTLDMSMTGLWNGDNGLEERWEDRINKDKPNVYYYSLRGLKNWFYNGPLPLAQFPACSQLTELHMPYPADNLTSEQKQFQAPLFKSLFQAYGSQLTKLECTYYTICELIGEEIFVMISSSSLKHLRIIHWPDQSYVVPREGVSTIKYPFYYRFTLQLGGILNHFRNCLEILELEFLHEQTIDDAFNKFDTTVVYPNMKRLTVYLTNLLSPMWEVFRYQFVGLEVIRFEVDWLLWGRYANTRANELERFFVIFPKLNYILVSWPSWFRRKDIVFKRSEVMLFNREGLESI